jgi:Outer membrane protein beta-barrel domain
MMIKPVLLALLLTGFSFGQTLSVGVLGGAPFTNVVNNGTVAPINTVVTSSNFTLGPSVQLNLPLNLRVEFDALYRPYGFRLYNQLVEAALNNGTSVSGQQWSFPLLLQYRFSFPIVRPFLEVGPSFQHLTGTGSLTSAITGPGQLLHSSNVGIVLGGGVDVKVPFVRLSGELRYTRESNSYFSNISNLNQAEVLFGIHF